MQKVIEKLKELIEDHEKRISRLESVLTKPTGKRKDASELKLSLKEFMILKNPTDDVLKTLYIGYYLEKHEGLSCFNAKDLEGHFVLAKEIPPSNINDKINQNIAKHFMMKAKEKKDKRKAWMLTSLGEKFVEKGLKNEKQ